MPSTIAWASSMIEWALMKWRQQFGGNRVLAGDWLLNIAIVE